MKEDLLHFIWKHQRFSKNELKTANNESLVIHKQGMHNQHIAGPDFLNAQIKIGEQRWAGNIEIHSKSSDWYAHNHQSDPNYSSVILHVVWEHDVEVFNLHDQIIPVIELVHFINKDLLEEYEKLIENKRDWIPCATSITNVDEFIWKNWLERLFIERLEQKSLLVKQLLDDTNNNWEEVCFALIAKSFGGNINGEGFMKVALSIPISIFQKTASSVVLEAVFMGQAGMLQEEIDEPHYKLLQQEYHFTKHKYQLKELRDVKMNYFKLRPPNFPTIRISQLVNLYTKNSNLFHALIRESSLGNLQDLLDGQVSEFWNTHYTFNKSSSKRTKKISLSTIELLIINTILPLRYAFEQHYGKFEEEKFISFFRSLKSEQNTIIKKFEILGVPASNAIDSQALIHLKKNYCDSKRCLECNVGYKLLSV